MSAVCSQGGGGAEEDPPLRWFEQPRWTWNWEESAQWVSNAGSLLV